jgi:hypothetical protein
VPEEQEQAAEPDDVNGLRMGAKGKFGRRRLALELAHGHGRRSLLAIGHVQTLPKFGRAPSPAI